MGIGQERYQKDLARRERDAALRIVAALQNQVYNSETTKTEAVNKAVLDTTAALSKDFNTYLDKKNQYFGAQQNSIGGSFDALMNKTKAEMSDLIKQVKTENNQLRTQITDNNANKNESKYVKSEYQKIELEKLYEQNKILWYVFYVLVLILGVVMFYFNTLTILAQTIIFHILLVYPFVIYYFELICYIIYEYLKSFFESTPFSNVYLGSY